MNRKTHSTPAAAPDAGGLPASDQKRPGADDNRPPEPDPIDEAALESFPASDPPTFTGATVTPSTKSAPAESHRKSSKREP